MAPRTAAARRSLPRTYVNNPLLGRFMLAATWANITVTHPEQGPADERDEFVGAVDDRFTGLGGVIDEVIGGQVPQAVPVLGIECTAVLAFNRSSARPSWSGPLRTSWRRSSQSPGSTDSPYRSLSRLIARIFPVMPSLTAWAGAGMQPSAGRDR